jgi:hypothetical protein
VLPGGDLVRPCGLWPGRSRAQVSTPEFWLKKYYLLWVFLQACQLKIIKYLLNGEGKVVDRHPKRKKKFQLNRDFRGMGSMET